MISCLCNYSTQTLLCSMVIESSGDPEQLAEALGLYTEECCGGCLGGSLGISPLLAAPWAEGGDNRRFTLLGPAVTPPSQQGPAPDGPRREKR